MLMMGYFIAFLIMYFWHLYYINRCETLLKTQGHGVFMIVLCVWSLFLTKGDMGKDTWTLQFESVYSFGGVC